MVAKFVFVSSLDVVEGVGGCLVIGLSCAVLQAGAATGGAPGLGLVALIVRQCCARAFCL